MDLEIFQKNFYTEYNQITDALNSLGNDDTAQNQKEKDEYELISNRVEILKKYFSENTAFIPIYEVRKAQENIGKLNHLAQEKREKLFPKKKFGFKSKQNMTSLECAIQKADTDTKTKNNQNQEEKVFTFENSCSIKDLIGEKNFLKNENEINDKDIAIINVKDSLIQLMGNPSVVHMSNVDSCTILCGPITGSAFISNCINSKIVIASHQLRIHETKNTQFYIHVGSRAIIENSNQVTFSPYSWQYPLLESHFDKSKLKTQSKETNWMSIDDFNWLNQEQKSPNWNFLDENERLKWTSNQNGELI